MDKKQLEISIQKLKGKDSFINSLEQYDTDPAVVADIVTAAFLEGNVSGKYILDLGTGNGAFAYAARMLGASKVLAVDIDLDAIAIARENCKGMNVEFEHCDVHDVKGNFDTCFTNPPWGSVRKDSDLPFIDAALRTSKIVYSILNAKGSPFMRNYLSERGEILREVPVTLTIKHRYPHHKKDRVMVNAALFVTASAVNH